MAAATLTTIAIGAAIGAGVGAIAGATVGGGGDAIWKGALTGAVGGAVTAGVGSWAGSAAGLGWGGVASGALAGGAGGLAAGLTGTALSGGNRTDYLKSGLFGGLGGAALGGAMGAMGNVNGELVTPETQPLDMTAATSVEGPTVPIQEITSTGATGIGGGNIDAAAAVDPTLAAQTPTVTQPSLDTGTPTLQDVVSKPTMYAANQTTTDVPLGMQDQPQLLPGGVDLNAPSTTESVSGSGLKMPKGTSFNLDTGIQVPDQTGLQTTGQVGIEVPESAYKYTPTTEEGVAAIKDMPAYKSPGSYDVMAPKTPEPSLWDKIGKGFKMDGDLGNYLKLAGYGQLGSGLMKTLGAAVTAPETSQNRQQLMDLYNTQMNQYNTQANAANKYQQNLQATYDNPEAYLNTPEAVASRQLAMRKLLAQNAMAGRRTAGLSMQNELMMNQLSNLQNYRRGLQGNIQYPNYSPAATTLNYAQAYSPTADIMGGLSSAVTPLSMYSLASLYGA